MERKGNGFIDRAGEIHMNTQGCKFKITEYFSVNNCTVEFEDGFIIKNVDYRNIKRKTVKNPYYPSVFGLGYLGIGKHKCYENGKRTKKFQIWNCMINRCQNKENNPTYQDITICEEWHNFQNFGEWFDKSYNPRYMGKWDLDKDIICADCRIYSPETCAFVPK